MEEAAEKMTARGKVRLILSLIPEKGKTTSSEISKRLRERGVDLKPQAVGQLIHHHLLYVEVDRERDPPKNNWKWMRMKK